MKFTYQFILSLMLVLLSLASALTSLALPANDNLRFVINAPGSSPYIYFDHEESRYRGVVVDFFESFDDSDAFNVKYIDSSRARNEKLVMSKEADVFFGSAIWLENPKKFIYSNTIMPHVSYIYSTKTFQEQFSLNAHNGALICTRHAFSYPFLQPYFNDGKLVRVDSSSQKSIVSMLSKGRCDFAIMSEENARGVMFDSEFCQNEFYQSPIPVMSDEVGFIINENLTQTRDNINQQLLAFINSGARDKSIQKHLKSRVFPKRVCQQTADTDLSAEY